MNIYDILKLKFPNADFWQDILLQDDGKGVYIKEWNMDSIPVPTQKDLEKWAIELDLAYRQQKAIERRIYPTIQEQLDMQYRDKINNTTEWVDTITSIKSSNPKPLE